LIEENVHFSRPKEIVRWNAAVREWCEQDPEVPLPPPNVLSIQPAEMT
jgi:hypothetical protein